MTRNLKVVLATLGDPERLSGGYLYHLRMRELAGTNDAQLTFASLRHASLARSFWDARHVLSELRKSPPDVLVVDSICAAAFAPSLNRLRGVPLAAAVHQSPGGIDAAGLARSVRRRADLRVYRGARAVIAASAGLAGELTGAGIAGERIRVVPPGRDVSELAVEAQRADQQALRQGRAAAALCVANWIPRKDILSLLEAVAALPASVVTLHLVGDTTAGGEYSLRVSRRLREPDLRERTVVHGALAREAVAHLYAAADFFVLPSRSEPYGTVYGEAMAYGLPPVGWASGNLPYLADDHVHGLVVPPGDLGALSGAISALATDESLRQRLGREARRRAATFPTWRETASVFFGVLRQIASA